MFSELDVLRIVSERLDAAQIPYMLTGSYALAFYTIDVDDVRSAVRSRSQFNLMHLKTGIKVDLIIRKAAEYRQVEFARRRQVNFAGKEIGCRRVTEERRR